MSVAVAFTGGAAVRTDHASGAYPGRNGRLALIERIPTCQLCFKTQLATMNADGSSRRVVKPALGPAQGPAAWSPDGARLAVVTGGSQGWVRGKNGIYLMNADGSSAKTLLPRRFSTSVGPAIGSVAWSPSGRTIAFAATLYKASQRSAIYTIGTDGRRLHRLRAWTRSTRLDSLSWSPSGRQLAFSRVPDAECCGDVFVDLYVMNADGSRLRQVLRRADPDGFATNLDWSPDGRSLALTLRTRTAAGTLARGVYVLDVAGGEPRLLAGGQETSGVPYTRDEAYDPTFSPDGRLIAFGRHISHGPFQPRWVGVSIMNAGGTGVRNVVGGIQPRVDWPPWEFHNLTWARRRH